MRIKPSNLTAMLCCFACANTPLVSFASKLGHEPEIVEAVSAAGMPCARYALRKTGAALIGYMAIHEKENTSRKDAWRNITYERYIAECFAEVAREVGEMPTFDLEKGSDQLRQLNPLYSPTPPPAHLDAVVARISANEVTYNGKVFTLAELLEKIWLEHWKSVGVNGQQPDEGWCLANLGYISGARIYMPDQKGNWNRMELNTGHDQGEKGVAVQINSCLSGHFEATTEKSK